MGLDMRFNDLRRNYNSSSPVDTACMYHNFSTQIVMDNRRSIVFIQSGFLGHNNDSAQLQMMPRIGNGGELHLPAGLYILADKVHPCEYPLLIPWRE